MARVNYAHGKRQREIASKAKREEKLQRKAERGSQAQDGVEGELEPLTAPEEGEGTPAAGNPEGV